MNRLFPKEDMQTVSMHMKICSSLLVSREIQIKTTVRYHHFWLLMTIIKNLKNIKCQHGCGEIVTLICCWWENHTATVEKSLVVCQKVKHKISISNNSTPRYILYRNSSSVITSTQLNMVQKWTQVHNYCTRINAHSNGIPNSRKVKTTHIFNNG